MQRVRVRFSRGGEAKYVSHLENLKVFERAFRRTEIPIAYSKGFNPRPEISFGVPISVGMTSEAEYFDAYLEGWVRPEAVIRELNEKLPASFRIVDAVPVSLKQGSLMALTVAAGYRVEVEGSENIGENISLLMGKSSIPIVRERKKGNKEVDLRPLIYELKGKRVEGRGEKKNSIEMVVGVGEKGTVKPEEIVGQLGDLQISSVHRVEQYFRGLTGFVSPMKVKA